MIALMVNTRVGVEKASALFTVEYPRWRKTAESERLIRLAYYVQKRTRVIEGNNMLKSLTVAAALLLSTAVAQAAPITFSSTLTFSSLATNKITLTSTGLNTALNVGDPATVIPNFILATVGTGAWSDNENVTASFLFTTPTPAGATNDSGFVVGGQVNGTTPSGSLAITWPSQPVLFNFLDGTQLEVSLGNLNVNCSVGQNCLAGAGPYNMSGSFRVLAGPTPRTAVPEPLTLTVFGAGLAGLALARRRKQSA